MRLLVILSKVYKYLFKAALLHVVLVILQDFRSKGAEGNAAPPDGTRGHVCKNT